MKSYSAPNIYLVDFIKYEYIIQTSGDSPMNKNLRTTNGQDCADNQFSKQLNVVDIDDNDSW